MAVANPVYYNAALSAFYRAAVPEGALAVPNPTSNPPSTAAQLIAQIQQFSPAAIAFATAVDSAIVAQSFSGPGYDAAVSSAAGTTATPTTAQISNGQATRPLMVSAMCESALSSVSANNGAQGGSGSQNFGLAPPPAHTPAASDYGAVAAAIAAQFAAYISTSPSGGEVTT